MKIRNIIIGAVLVGVALAMVPVLMPAGARGGPLQGPVITTHADFTCPAATGAATPGIPLAASTPVTGTGAEVSNRMCAECDWVSGSPARVGDANISASQGIPIAAATSAAKTFCVDGPVYCFGVGGTSVQACNEVTRQ